LDLGQPSQEDYGTQAFLTQDDSRLSFFSVDSPAAKPRHDATQDDMTSPAGDAAPEERVPEDTATQMDVPTQIMDHDNVATHMDTELSVAPTQRAAPQDTDVPTQMDSVLDVPTQLASQDAVSPEKAAVLACDAATQATLVPPMEAADSCEDAMED
jgi:hypothetical protein